MNVTVTPKQIPIYMTRIEKGEVTDHIILARKETFSAVHPTNHRKES